MSEPDPNNHQAQAGPEPQAANVAAADVDGSTQVQIADEPGDTPYQNLWVPLIVVPAGIVMALVGVFALFGAISTDTNSLADNLALVVRGGANERDQALFALMQQAAENNMALSEDREPPHAIEPGFTGQVSKALEDLDPKEHNVRLALAVLLGTLDDPRGAENLGAFLDLPDAEDEDGKLRIAAIQNLALLADHSAEAVDGDAFLPRLEILLGHTDPGLRGMATSLLGILRCEGGRERLVQVLGDDDLGVRATAALALSRLEPPDSKAIFLLLDLVSPELYQNANNSDRTQFGRPDDVSQFRIWAVEALARYGAPEGETAIRGLLQDSDLRVREAAMLALGDAR